MHQEVKAACSRKWLQIISNDRDLIRQIEVKKIPYKTEQ